MSQQPIKVNPEHLHSDEIVEADEDASPVYDTATLPSAPVLPDHAPRPTGGIVDRDFVRRRELPTYTFAGTSMGGENLMDCDHCRALVKQSGTPAHDAFHAIVNGAANRVGMQAGG